MHKYDGIPRLKVNIKEEKQQDEKKADEKSAVVRSFVRRMLAALGLVLALFLGKYSGIARIRQAAESVKNAICYDVFSVEEVQDEKDEETA